MSFFTIRTATRSKCSLVRTHRPTQSRSVADRSRRLVASSALCRGRTPDGGAWLNRHAAASSSSSPRTRMRRAGVPRSGQVRWANSSALTRLTWCDPARPALLCDHGQPIPGRRRHTGGRRDQLYDGRVLYRPPRRLAARGRVGEPPLATIRQGVEARVIRGPVERRVVLEVERKELRIAEGVALFGYPDGGLLG